MILQDHFISFISPWFWLLKLHFSCANLVSRAACGREKMLMSKYGLMN